MASNNLKETYMALRKAINMSGQGLDDDILEIMPDSMLEPIIKRMEAMLDTPPTKHNMGGIVSLDQLMRPLGVM